MKRIARFIRKLADFIDPRIDPSDVITVTINLDTSEAMAQIEKLRGSIDALPDVYNYKMNA
jgi:hypothetical protein